LITGRKKLFYLQNPADDNGLAVSKSIKVIKCNGLKTKPFGRDGGGGGGAVSQVVVIGKCTLINGRWLVLTRVTDRPPLKP